MSLQTNIKKLQAERGFTIVELLIVIVVIAILAAITIVAYNGITARANSSSALASAQGAAKKIEVYNSEEGVYPPTSGAGNAAAPGLAYSASKSYYLPTTTFESTTIAAKPASATMISANKCGTGTTSSLTTYTGVKITYWKFDGTPGIRTINVGDIGSVCLTATL